MFKKLKNWLTHWKREARAYKRWEEMSGVLEEKIDKSITNYGIISSRGLEEAFAIYRENEWLNNQQSEKEEKIAHVEDALCGSCKKKITVGIKESGVVHNEPAIVKIVCNSSVVYRFHLDCWNSVNSVLDEKFEMKTGVKIDGE